MSLKRAWWLHILTVQLYGKKKLFILHQSLALCALFEGYPRCLEFFIIFFFLTKAYFTLIVLEKKYIYLFLRSTRHFYIFNGAPPMLKIIKIIIIIIILLYCVWICWFDSSLFLSIVSSFFSFPIDKVPSSSSRLNGRTHVIKLISRGTRRIVKQKNNNNFPRFQWLRLIWWIQLS